ncbi:MAG TPA: SRPBCC domain-containing protein [Gemmatimonadaceae bacterium]|jgi:Plastocyanin
MNDGGEIAFHGKSEYLELDCPHRIVYTQWFTDEEGNISRHPFGPHWREKMHTTVELAEEAPDRTRVTVTWAIHGAATPEKVEEFDREKGGLTQGWMGSFEKLEAMLEEAHQRGWCRARDQDYVLHTNAASLTRIIRACRYPRLVAAGIVPCLPSMPAISDMHRADGPQTNRPDTGWDGMTSMRRVALGIIIAGVTSSVAMACGGSGGDPTDPGPSNDHTITASSALAFGPATLTVKVGDVVTFDFGSVAHNVFFDAKEGAPPDITGQNANVSVQRTLATAGTYHYICHIHPSMQGTIVVQ